MKYLFTILLVPLFLATAAFGQECARGEYNVGHCVQLPATYKRTKRYLFTSREELTYEFTNKCENRVHLIAASRSGQTITKTLDPHKPTFLYCDLEECVQYVWWLACSEVHEPESEAVTVVPPSSSQPAPQPNSTQPIPFSEGVIALDGPRLSEPIRSPIQSAPEPSLQQLKQLAHDALNEYYRRHGSDSKTAPSGIEDLYASQVIWYNGPRLSPSEIVQKKLHEVFNKWPIRRFWVLEDSLVYDCNPPSDSCRVSGTVDFSFRSSGGKVLNNHTLVEFVFSDLSWKPKVSSELSRRDPLK